MIHRYPVKNLSLPVLANPKYQNLSFTESNKHGHRVIGGDKGDIYFEGYTLEENSTILYKPILQTLLELNEDEVEDIANEIVQFSFDSIGIETVEHS